MIAPDSRPEGADAAGRLLRNLLVENVDYRAEWQRKATTPRRGEVNLAAVTKVLAEELVRRGDCTEKEAELLARNKLRHKVSRALAGSHLSADTLELFISAFLMNEDDVHRLWAAFSGGANLDYGVAFTIKAPREMARRQWHRTLALFERYWVDAGGCLSSRHTMHTLMAVEDGVDRYLFNHEPAIQLIDVHAGGRLGEHHEYGDGLVADDIVLDRPLSKGQTVSLEYSSSYRHGGKTATEVRRPARARSENVSIGVQFETGRLPTKIWWAVWADHYEGGPVREFPDEIDDRGLAHHFASYVEQAVIGFRWEW